MCLLKGILTVPKSLDDCEKLCLLLLQLELLKLRRPDLKPVELGNLIDLVGRSRSRPPQRSDAIPAEAFIREALADIPPPLRPDDQLGLFIDALEDLNRDRVDPPPPPESFDPREGPTMAGLRETIGGRVREALALKGLVAVPLPVKPRTSRPLIDLTKVIPGVGRALKNPDTAEAACRFVGAFFLASLLKPATPPRVRLAAGVAAFGCAIGVSRGT